VKSHFFYDFQQYFDELYSNGCLVFLEVLKKYDPEKGKLSTYLTSSLQSVFDIYLRENKDILHVTYDDELLESSPCSGFARFCELLEFYDCTHTELSEDAQNVLSHIISNPQKRHTKNSVTCFFREHCKWSIKQVECAYEEVERWWRGASIA